jgi:hypothetical protein
MLALVPILVQLHTTLIRLRTQLLAVAVWVDTEVLVVLMVAEVAPEESSAGPFRLAIPEIQLIPIK